MATHYEQVVEHAFGRGAGPVNIIRKGEHGDDMVYGPAVETMLIGAGRHLKKQLPKIMADTTDDVGQLGGELNMALRQIGQAIENFKPMKKELTEEVRGMRMNVTHEVAAMLKPLEDVRQFFLGDTHETEIGRLREFVDLCERLQKLKESGFLDTVADTMLKLT